MFWLLSTCTLQFVLSRPCASCWFALLPSPCQGSTSAAAREKLRYCEVYLAIHSDEAGAWLCPAFANGGATGPSKYIDLQLYLNAAHGGSFSFSTQIDRQKVIKQKVLDPKAPVPEAAGMTLKETNVHVIFLQQELFLSNWWAPVAANKPYINIYSPINIPWNRWFPHRAVEIPSQLSTFHPKKLFYPPFIFPFGSDLRMISSFMHPYYSGCSRIIFLFP